VARKELVQGVQGRNYDKAMGTGFTGIPLAVDLQICVA